VTVPPVVSTIPALHAAYAAGWTSAQAVAETYRRVEAADDPGIFISLAPEAETLAVARALGAFDPVAKPLWGVPFAIKDNIDLAGLPTTAACPAYAYCPTVSAEAVARLVAAGAIPIGKTNLDQFATGLVGMRTPYPVPRNAIDPALVPGGSSSGSAVAVARGLVPFALGTDTAGSGRIPAGFNNIVGLKPTHGAVSTRGIVPACRTLDCVSVFAATVEDAAAVYRMMSGFDAADPYSRRLPPPAMSTAPTSGWRLGVPDAGSLQFAGDRAAEAAFRLSLRDLDAVGMQATAIDLSPLLEAGRLLYEGPWVAERHHAVGDFIARHPQAVDPIVRRIIGGAAKLTAVDAFAGLYRLAELRRVVEPMWHSVDCLVVPTFPRPRTIADVAADPIGVNAELGTYSTFANLLDLCALTVPGRRREDGLPSSVTLIAPAGCDSSIAAVGAAFQARTATPSGAAPVR
jgi:allophanate hydrolase